MQLFSLPKKFMLFHLVHNIMHNHFIRMLCGSYALLRVMQCSEGAPILTFFSLFYKKTLSGSKVLEINGREGFWLLVFPFH